MYTNDMHFKPIILRCILSIYISSLFKYIPKPSTTIDSIAHYLLHSKVLYTIDLYFIFI